MRKEYQYKLQGDGRDSWTVSEYDENNLLINKYMVYEDPNINQSKLLSEISKATPEELDEIKRLLGLK